MNNLKNKFMLSEEVQVLDSYHYLINCNQEPLGITETKSEAVLIIDSLADCEMKRLGKNKNILCYKREVYPNFVIISTQQLGYIYSGCITDDQIFSYTQIFDYKLVKNKYVLTPDAEEQDQDLELET